MGRYAVTIFLSAFLLFQVQPLIGRLILPWFGGSPAVWTTCMLFFQVLLLAGYAYAHWITSRFSIRVQRLLHLLLLLASLAFLPIASRAAAWKPVAGDMPVEHILVLLGATIGLPYFLLSSTGPLLQESFRRETGLAPYRLYSLSNIGSLLALVSYPFVFEPQLTLHAQSWAWSAGYVLFVIGCGWCALRFAPGIELESSGKAAAAATRLAQADRPAWSKVLLWLALAACGSMMLLATTNQMCQEISTVPFLWVLPLAIYLFTFIICFDHERWYHRNLFLVLLTVALVVAGVTLYAGSALGVINQLASYSATLFVCCMVCHGELAHAKPAPQFATLFYLVVSAGGALGGILVALIAPLVLPDYWEYQIGLVATVVLAFVATFGPRAARLTISRGRLAAAGAVSAIVGVTIILAVRAEIGDSGDEKVLARSRNFYGVLRVNLLGSRQDVNLQAHEMMHGQTQHGFQFLDPKKRDLPTTYYGESSGIGLALRHHPRRQSADPAQRTLRIGVVGLGCGTLAVYGETGDTMRFYEINPEVVRLSEKYFTYRRDSRATLEIVLGDARINLERELAEGHPQRFDVLAVDAFNSDSIPIHLLTKECVELYRKHLQPDGLLCVHLSNKLLELTGIVQSIALALGCHCAFVDSPSDVSQGTNLATWAIVTDNAQFLATPEVRKSLVYWDTRNPLPPVWTDDYGSLWHVLKH
jgi:hypothetical protein